MLDLKGRGTTGRRRHHRPRFAKQTLAQSQDRFAAGVTNNVEVIQAQQQLATANDQYIASLYEHNIAKVLLARAIGNAEQLAKQYLADRKSCDATKCESESRPRRVQTLPRRRRPTPAVHRRRHGPSRMKKPETSDSEQMSPTTH